MHMFSIVWKDTPCCTFAPGFTKVLLLSWQCYPYSHRNEKTACEILLCYLRVHLYANGLWLMQTFSNQFVYATRSLSGTGFPGRLGEENLLRSGAIWPISDQGKAGAQIG